MSNASESYRELITEVKELAVLESTLALLAWDERTYMPAGGAELRATQESLLARRMHEQFTSSRMADLWPAPRAAIWRPKLKATRR